MTQDENSLSGRMPASRRSFVKGLGAAGTVLPALAVLPRWSFAEGAAATYASAAIDWKQFSGQTITLAGAIHPWSNAITPLLPQFTKLTGIDVVTDFQMETAFLGALPIKLAGGSRTPDIFMFLTYGQGISAGWLEPLNAPFSDKSLTDLAWYDESDLLKTARAFPVWSDGERYAFPITSEAVTLFINSDALAAKNLPVPQTFEELLATAKATKTNEMSGIAMRAQAGGNSSPAAMSYVFSYGGANAQGNRAGDRRSRARDDTPVSLVKRGFQAGVRPAGRRGGADQLAKRRCRPCQGDPFPSAIETHPGRLHDRRQ